MQERFAPAVARIPQTSLEDLLRGTPCPLLAAGGAQLGELIALAGLPGKGALPRPWSRIHGVRHLRMVAVLGVKLALAEGWDPRDPGGLCDLWCLWVAGCLHDLGREDDGIDPGHAERGAGIAEGYLRECRVGEAASATVVRLIRSHGTKDESGLAPLDKVFKDADGLDRHRLGRDDCRRGRLRTATARAWFDEVRALYWKP